MCWLAGAAMRWRCSFFLSFPSLSPSPADLLQLARQTVAEAAGFFSPTADGRRLPAGREAGRLARRGDYLAVVLAGAGRWCSWGDAGSASGAGAGAGRASRPQKAFVNIAKYTIAIFAILTYYFMVSKQQNLLTNSNIFDKIGYTRKRGTGWTAGKAEGFPFIG